MSLVDKSIAGLRVLDYAPEIEMFAERNGGMVILFNLALAGPADSPFPPAAPTPLSINARATTFSVSRKHLSTMLRDAEALHLLARGGLANDEVAILPCTRNALEMPFADDVLIRDDVSLSGAVRRGWPGRRRHADRTILAAV